MNSLTLPQFGKKYNQRFPAKHHYPYNDKDCKLVPMDREGWENVWECINSGCYLMVVAKKK